VARILGVLLFLLLPADALAQLVLNEVLYDPAGSDRGKEFVELYACGESALSLDGIRLLFVNGAAPEQPSEIWTAPAGIMLSPGKFFVIGGSEVLPRDVEANLSLQNGPDALWLARGDQVLDRLAWGELEGLGEGAPAPDVASKSLGRVPDGRDQDDNAADFHPLSPPSPGLPNASETSLHLLRIEATPAFAPLPAAVTIELIAEADGFAPQQEFSLRWSLDDAPLDQMVLGVAAKDSLRSRVEAWMTRGRHLVEVSWGADSTSVARMGYQVGPGSVLLNEVMAKPRADHPEWIELKQGVGAPEFLDGWEITDATESWKGLDGLGFSPDGFALLSSDPDAMRSIFSLSSELPIITPSGGWPSLNNTQTKGSPFADQILLRDASGTVVDQLAYGEDLLADAGRSMERGIVSFDSPRAWFVSPGEPSPGQENAAAALDTPAQGLALEPNPFSPDGDGEGDVLHVLLHADLTGLTVQAEVRDLLGSKVIELGSEEAGGDLRQWLWDGRAANGQRVPMGAYVVVVQSEGGRQAPRRWTALVALGRRR
jgi:hypothetical protein